jgi:hypothetical protein
MRVWSLGITFLAVSSLVGSAAAATMIPSESALRHGPVHRLTSCPALPGGTGILADGDFSLAPDQGTGDTVYSNRSIFAPSWIVSKGNIDFLGSAYWHMAGYCSIDLDGDNRVGGVKTAAFPTAKGATYTVAFLMSGNGGAPPTVKTMTLQAAGQFTQFTWDTSNNNDVEHGVYAQESCSFKAGGSRGILRFTSSDPIGSGRGIVIAAVSVTKK